MVIRCLMGNSFCPVSYLLYCCCLTPRIFAMSFCCRSLSVLRSYIFCQYSFISHTSENIISYNKFVVDITTSLLYTEFGTTFVLYTFYSMEVFQMTIVYLGTMHCQFTDQKSGDQVNGYKLFYAVDELDYKNWSGCVVKSSWHPVGDPLIEKIPELVPFDRYVPAFAFGGKRILSLDTVK